VARLEKELQTSKENLIANIQSLSEEANDKIKELTEALDLKARKITSLENEKLIAEEQLEAAIEENKRLLNNLDEIRNNSSSTQSEFMEYYLL
jgi:hypothetical protein